MTQSPRILAIGGVDPSGGAGLACDARMIQARGAIPAVVPAVLTVQSNAAFHAWHAVDGDLFASMVHAALEDGHVGAVKTGLLADAATVRRVAELLRGVVAEGVALVVDPVLGATARGLDSGLDVIDAYLGELLPLATIVTPNIPEAQRLAGGDSARLLATQVGAVLIKGGHGGGDVIEDRLSTSSGEVVLRHPRIDVGEVRGTGCALASAIACELAHGAGVEEACRRAVRHMTRCLERTTPAVGGGSAMLAIA